MKYTLRSIAKVIAAEIAKLVVFHCTANGRSIIVGTKGPTFFFLLVFYFLVKQVISQHYLFGECEPKQDDGGKKS